MKKKGGKIGYNVNAKKPYLIIKQQYKDKTKEVFENLLKILTEGHQHLGWVIGGKRFSKKLYFIFDHPMVWRNNRITINPKDSLAGSTFCIYIRLQIQVYILHENYWKHGGVVVITTAQLHSIKSELRFCACSNPARGMSEIRNDEDLWQWFRLEIRLNAFRQSTIPQKQFIDNFMLPLGKVIKQKLIPALFNDFHISE